MKVADIIQGLNAGKYVMWVDDKQKADPTPEYLEANFVGFADTPLEGKEYCNQLQRAEREKNGRATTRYRISSLNEDYVCSEDLDEPTTRKVVENLPTSEADKQRVIGQLKKH